MDDNEYDLSDGKILDNFKEWSERLTDKINNEELEYVPDAVALFVGLNIAARRVANLSRRHLITKSQAIQIFKNFIENIKESVGSA